jgi:CelD/BcsL family acetyltransferase involved in cellulose biosynthesis
MIGCGIASVVPNPADSHFGAAKLAEVDPLRRPDWDEAVAALPGATIFHSAAWARTLVSAYGYLPRYLIAGRGGRLTFALPLLEVRSWLTGSRGVSLPFTDEVPALGDHDLDPAGLDAELRRLAGRHGWRYVETRGNERPGVPASETFWNHTLDLTGGPDALFAGCDSSTRRATRKALQGSLRVEFSHSITAVKEFYRLLGRTRQRHGVPPQPFSFFAALHKEVLSAGHGCVVLARREGQAIAGAVYLHFGSTATYKYGASDERYQQLRGNNLVMWQAISHFATAGFARLDFGRTDHSNEGLRSFKLGWGARERLVSYHRMAFPDGKFIPASSARSSHSALLFQRLPRPVSRLIGAALYKHAG